MFKRAPTGRNKPHPQIKHASKGHAQGRSKATAHSTHPVHTSVSHSGNLSNTSDQGGASKHSSDHTAHASKSMNKIGEASKKEGRPTDLSFAARNHRAKQLSPNNPLYYKCCGGKGEKEKPASLPKAAAEYRSKQLNPNNLLYIKSRAGSSDPDHLAGPKQE